MASNRKRVRYTLELHFSGEEERDAFSTRLRAVRQLLSPTGAARVDNTALMSALFDAVERTSASSQPTASAESSLSSSCSSFQRNSGE